MTSISIPSPLRLPLLFVVLVGGSVLSYAGWLGWDRQYQLDPVTGDVSGLYQAWQVVGCVVTLSVLAMVAGLLGSPALAVATVPVVFTLAWSRDAAREDGSGLWFAGAVMLVGGLLGGVAIVAFLAYGVRRWRARLGGRRQFSRA